MDTSELYIKMCDCPEIQEQWRAFSMKSPYDLMWRDSPSNEYDNIWLPMQDQIQEMLPECKCPCCLIVHLNKFVEENIDGFADRGIDSMEQYWLAFYMSEKHSKIWGKEGWEIAGK